MIRCFMLILMFLFPAIPGFAGDFAIRKKKADPIAAWSPEKAAKWYDAQGWISGCNYQPSTAINQIEMWQGPTFDPKTIEKELGWAAELGFNTMRVYLSSVVWKENPAAFKKRFSQYLAISDKFKIRTIPVFFDDCWNPESALGKQPEPLPGVHNSGWVQDPAFSLRQDTTALYIVLESYVKDIISTYRNDKRILMWDLYNEPGNTGYGDATMPLLTNVFRWARQVNPSQPLTSAVWCFGCIAITPFQATNSDIITYHNYGDVTSQQTSINILKVHNRPLVCTAYLARKHGSRFETVMPFLKENKIGAINKGFVAGKTNFIFAWDEPLPGKPEPDLWFHDIYRPDKTPFDPKEIEIIKKMNGK